MASDDHDPTKEEMESHLTALARISQTFFPTERFTTIILICEDVGEDDTQFMTYCNRGHNHQGRRAIFDYIERFLQATQTGRFEINIKGN